MRDGLLYVLLKYSGFMGRYIACQNGRHALPPKLSVHLVSGEVKSILRAVNSLGS